jgi:hypothetical protein
MFDRVTVADHRSMAVRVLASAATSAATFVLRRELREKFSAFLAQECPRAGGREEFSASPASRDAGGGEYRLLRFSSGASLLRCRLEFCGLSGWRLCENR